MTIGELKDLKPEDVISLIKTAGSSTHKIAEGLDDVSQTTVSQIINNKYSGSAETINKVWERVLLLVQYKADLNTIIYPDAKIYVKLLGIAIKHKSFNDDETMKLIETKKILESFINNQ